MKNGILFILLFVIPSLEMLLLLGASSFTGVWHLIGISCITALAGLWMMRREDFSLWILFEIEIQNQRIPIEELLHDLCFWLGGGALIIPGFLTDAIGIALIIPAFRQGLIEWIQHFLRLRWEQQKR